MFAAPKAPVNLRVLERNAHGIQLMWQHPSITNGKLRKFGIHVRLISSHLRRLEQDVKMSERLLEVQQPSRSYSSEVSDLGIYNFCNETVMYFIIWNTYCCVQESTQK